MAISVSLVEYISNLAKLEVPAAQKAAFTQNLNAVLDYVDILNQVDTANVAPTTHILPKENVFRADICKQSLPREEALANAAERSEGYFCVPRIL